jgi:hypothetical protein
MKHEEAGCSTTCNSSIQQQQNTVNVATEGEIQADADAAPSNAAACHRRCHLPDEEKAAIRSSNIK